MRNLLKYPLISVLLLLTACGGGGSSSTSNQDESDVTETATANTTTTVTRASAVTANADVSAVGGGVSYTEVTIDTTRSITISWAPPATNANGDPLDPSDIRGYEISYSSADSAASGGEVIYVDLGTTTELTIETLPAGTYQFSIAAIESGS